MIAKLKRLACQSGVDIEIKANGHVQLKGSLLVNYYPNSKDKTAYVSGTVKAFKNVSPEKAVKMCFSAPEINGKKDKRSGGSKAKRERLINKGVTSCYWCKTPLTLESSTLEHIIPLGRGGLDNANNRTLACKSCNEDRGSEMPELKSIKGSI